jgi:hypothetical protein
LIANNTEIKGRLAAGHRLSEEEELVEYRKIVQEISPRFGRAGVSIEVFSDRKSTAREMFAQGKEMYSWIPNRIARQGVDAFQENGVLRMCNPVPVMEGGKGKYG